MQRGVLLNPFSLNPDPASGGNRQEQARKASSQAVRSTPVCSRCESDDIISYVTAQWSNEQQAWELADTFDQPAHCNRCNSACEIDWRPL